MLACRCAILLESCLYDPRCCPAVARSPPYLVRTWQPYRTCVFLLGRPVGRVFAIDGFLGTNSSSRHDVEKIREEVVWPEFEEEKPAVQARRSSSKLSVLPGFVVLCEVTGGGGNKPKSFRRFGGAPDRRLGSGASFSTSNRVRIPLHPNGHSW